MLRGGGGRAVRVVSLLAAVAAALLGLAQLVLPPIAADRISSKVARYGHVDSVHVSAWPAVELLWGDADSVRVRASSLRIGSAEIAKLLGEASGTVRVDASVADARVDGVPVGDAVLRKRGVRLRAEATITRAQIAEALPGIRIALLSSAKDRVRVRVGGGLFGLAGGVQAEALASEGALVAEPVSAALAGLRLTLFADRRVQVDGVGAAPLDSTRSAYRLSLTGRLR
jgi:hypothetical protein